MTDARSRALPMEEIKKQIEQFKEIEGITDVHLMEIEW